MKIRSSLYDPRQGGHDAQWVGDRENGLAHIAVGMILEEDISLCGVDLVGASPGRAVGRVRCGMCSEGLRELMV